MIRLQRTGKRGQAYFRVVILEHTSRVKGKYLELLGNYNPHQKQFQVKKDRVEYWISKGAQISPTVNNLMVNYKVWDKPKMQSWKPKKSKTQNEKGKTAEIKSAESVPAVPAVS
ncbi:MAG: 30S ribosomal protein S16 [Candidatus Taylorbacteria bacterium]|nr:30S ribosomal protein S16 [Candidatus Taylorbacteria bacterium]